jgi:hypothetical protein
LTCFRFEPKPSEVRRCHFIPSLQPLGNPSPACFALRLGRHLKTVAAPSSHRPSPPSPAQAAARLNIRPSTSPRCTAVVRGRRHAGLACHPPPPAVADADSESRPHPTASRYLPHVVRMPRSHLAPI